MNTTPARIGLLGCGLWGANILRDLQALGASVLVVDSDAGARDRAGLAGADEVVDSPTGHFGVDGWIVATPASRHLECLDALAGYRAPILCEKPLLTSSAEARALAGRLQAPLHVLDVWRYHPAVEHMQALVASGELGAVHGMHSSRGNWTSPRTDVDTVWNLAPHEVSIYRQVFGAYPEPESALAERIDGQARSLWSRWHGPGWMISELSNRLPARRRELRLHCERGVAVFDAARPSQLEIASGAANEQLGAVEVRRIDLGGETALQRQLKHWLGFITGGDAPRSDLAHALSTIELVERVRELAGLDA